MSTGFAIKRATDSGAPVLSGTAGALVAVLDWALDDWDIAFTDTNKRSYRATSGIRHYLDIDDTGTTSAAVRAYESMTAVGTGTDPYPTPAQKATSLWGKSSAASSAARDYIVIKTDRWMMIAIQITGSGTYAFYDFGEMKSEYAIDAWCSTIFTGANAVVSGSGFTTAGISSSYYGPSTSGGRYWARAADGIEKSVDFLGGTWQSTIDLSADPSGRFNTFPINLPSGISSVSAPRAYMPYVLGAPYSGGVNTGDTLTLDGVAYECVLATSPPVICIRLADDPEQP